MNWQSTAKTVLPGEEVRQPPNLARPYCPDNLPYIGGSKINKGTSSKPLKNGELLWDLDEIELGARCLQQYIYFIILQKCRDSALEE